MKKSLYSKYTSSFAASFSLFTLGKAKNHFKRTKFSFFLLAILLCSTASVAQENFYKADAILEAPVNPEAIANFINSKTTSGSAHSRVNNDEEVISPVFGAISGPGFVCAFTDTVTYSVAISTDPSGNPMQFHWFLPADWSIVSGQGTNTVRVVPGIISGQVAVFAIGYCICSYACKPVISEDCGVISPLPVKLVTFEAIQSGNSVLINWVTAEEKDNDRFEIERSTDGKNFANIGSVKGLGNSNSRMSYSFEDKDLSGSIAYYRLKQIDFDGSFEYSPVRAVEAQKLTSAAIKVFPNPATDFITIQPEGELSNSVIRVLSLTGQVVWSGSFGDLSASQNKVDLSRLTSGVYIATFTSGQSTESIRIIKN